MAEVMHRTFVKTELRKQGLTVADLRELVAALDAERVPGEAAVREGAAAAIRRLSVECETPPPAEAEPPREPGVTMTGAAYGRLIADLRDAAAARDAAERREVDLRGEVDRYRAHSITLNSLGWRMAKALGLVDEGDAEVSANTADMLDRLIAERAGVLGRMTPAEALVIEAAREWVDDWREQDSRGLLQPPDKSDRALLDAVRQLDAEAPVESEPEQGGESA